MQNQNSMPITEDALLDLWQQQRNYHPFVRDGIICPSEYSLQSKKILFILKDADNLNADLRQFLRTDNSCSWKTWDNVARWAQALIEGGECWDNQNHNQLRHKWLNKIAAINLKKQAGAGTAVMQDVEAFACRDREFLLQQISLIHPDAIICCGWKDKSVAEILHDTVLQCSSHWHKIDGTRYNMFMYGNIPVVSFIHPNMRNQKYVEPRYKDMLKISEYIFVNQPHSK